MLRAPAAPRPRAAAEHLRINRITETRPPLAPQRAGQCRGDRGIPRHPRHRPCCDDAAHALLLRVIGDPQPPPPRCRPDPHDPLGQRPRVLGPLQGPPGHQLRWSALHLRSPRPDRVQRTGSARPAVHHAGRRAARTGPRAGLLGTGSTAGLGVVRHVRADRGDRPDGVPTTGTRRHPPAVDRTADSRRILPARTGRRRPGRRR